MIAAILGATGVLYSGCGGGETTAPPPGSSAVLELSLERLAALDPATEGRYETWVIAPGGEIRSAGRFDAPAGGTGQLELNSPLGAPAFVMITVEPPGDTDDRPSQQKLIGGEVRDGSAALEYVNYLTPGIALEPAPGTHVLFTPSDNAELGYPSNEDAGLWMFNIEGDTLRGDFYLTYTPLTRGWTYEGWIVYDYGTPAACWISYGKFQPNNRSKQDQRDDTGLGPFSGQLDYERAMPDEIVFPGDDWVSNPHGFEVPCGLELPFDLNGEPALGIESRWTHVITIEPDTEEDEPPVGRSPFFLRPYRNAFGEGFADEPRTILYYPDDLPSGTARIRAR